ncbi:hypothetical protein EVAR_76296_1 [Eumeta japonica]|uniref:Uncharacterized protein n=1 Tax=Eumeta variegata TaxID=151549 RepID=A0A4C1UP10_EUMVA|nr:hypothetical protein EVAR_76296_1 [Eumeta japonica]
MPYNSCSLGQPQYKEGYPALSSSYKNTPSPLLPCLRHGWDQAVTLECFISSGLETTDLMDMAVPLCSSETYPLFPGWYLCSQRWSPVGRDEVDKSDDFDSFTECGRTAHECRRRVTYAMDDDRLGINVAGNRHGSVPFPAAGRRRLAAAGWSRELRSMT